MTKTARSLFLDCNCINVRSVRTPLVFLSTYDVWTDSYSLTANNTLFFGYFHFRFIDFRRGLQLNDNRIVRADDRPL